MLSSRPAVRPGILARLTPATLAITVASLGLATPARAQDCAQTSVGFIPLSDPGAGHLGEPGGLYPGGVNFAPASHVEATLLLARRGIVPLDASGQPSPSGVIVLASIGMSNTTQEFSTFITQQAGDPELHPRLRIVDLAQGGREAGNWADPASDVWAECDRRLAVAGLTPRQVQVAWIKLARRQPASFGAFPAHALEMLDRLREIVALLRDHFPNLRLAHVSSRIYAGYATTTLNPEPYAFEEGFSFRWLIEDQLDGDPALNPDAALGPVESPWLLWGPYLWADGMTPRSDGLVWECADLGPDGTHPSPAGRMRVSSLLSAFYRTDPTARPWFLTPVDLRARRSGSDVVLSWTGARAPWLVERSDVANGPWSVLDGAAAATTLGDPDVGSGTDLRFYAVW